MSCPQQKDASVALKIAYVSAEEFDALVNPKT